MWGPHSPVPVTARELQLVPSVLQPTGPQSAPGNAETRPGITRLGSFQSRCRAPAGVLTLGLFVFLLAWLIFVLESRHCTASGTAGAVLELLLCFSASTAPAVRR